MSLYLTTMINLGAVQFYEVGTLFAQSDVNLSQSLLSAITCGPHSKMRYKISRDYLWVYVLNKY